MSITPAVRSFIRNGDSFPWADCDIEVNDDRYRKTENKHKSEGRAQELPAIP